MNNLAYAKSSLKACEMHYEVQISHAKIKFVNEYKEKHSSSRLPSAEIINTIVNNSCAESYVAKNLDECMELAKISAEVTHNHPEGIKGAQAIAAAIFFAKEGNTKKDILKIL